MTHDEFEELINAYLDFEVTAIEKKAVQDHLESCATCINLYDTNKSIKKKLYHLNQLIPVPQLLDEELASLLNDISGK